MEAQFTISSQSPESHGRIICQEKRGIVADEEFWKIEGVPVAIEHRREAQILVEALVLRPDGTFVLFFQATDDQSSNPPTEICEISQNIRSDFAKLINSWTLCRVSGPAAFAVQDWFEKRRVPLVQLRVLRPPADEAARREHIIAEVRSSPAGKAARRGDLLIEHGLDDPSVQQRRDEVLREYQFDPDSLRKRIEKALHDRGLDAASIEKRRASLLAKHEVDDQSIERKRAELLAKHGLD